MLISKFGYNKLVRMNNVKNDHISKQQQTSIDKRGKEIHENGHIRHIDNGVFCVQSQTHNDTFYDVVLSEECDSKCTCPYYTKQNNKCKHIIAAEYHMQDCIDVAGCSSSVSESEDSQCRLNCKCGATGCSGVPKGMTRCTCKCKCRRDAKAYDLLTSGGKMRVLELIIELIDMAQIVPYELGVGFGGRRGYEPKTMLAIIIVLKTLVQDGCRNMSGYLRDNPEICRMLNLTSIPSKNTISRAYARTSPECLRRLIKMTTAEIKVGDTATDSSGFGTRTYELWSSVKKDEGLRKGYLKLHIMIDIDTRMILDHEVTKSNISDIRTFRKFLERFDISKCSGKFMCADAAYLARDVCTIIEKLGYVPRIMPKKNSIARAKGHQAWRSMMLFYKQAYNEFVKEYGKRNIVESVFGSIKQVYGNALRMRLPKSRETEIMLNALCHNATYLCRHRLQESDCLYPEQPGLQQYIERGLDSNRNIVGTGPTALDIISKLVEKGILSSNQNMDDIFNAIQMIENEYYYRPRFYSPGSSQYESVMKVVAQFDTIASTTTAA